MKIGDQLRKLRGDISQTRIAQELDISQTAYNKWESNKSKPSISNLLKLSQYYNKNLYNLIGIETNNHKENTMSIGTRLSQLRKQKNLSSSQVAQKLDISEIVYNKLENDEAKPEMDLLKKISDLYEIEIFDLLKSENSSIILYNNKIEATNLINQN